MPKQLASFTLLILIASTEAILCRDLPTALRGCIVLSSQVHQCVPHDIAVPASSPLDNVYMNSLVKYCSECDDCLPDAMLCIKDLIIRELDTICNGRKFTRGKVH
ncbi:hypothetical protein FGIG_04207 [Fasciola gigantica]|uniref:Saposin B-type domain-containing protein n=1 Tax=Fasciola gigantica TaxID=46835 RepID=A0A504YQK2_FASGI|nr:hypothetical protein FGIG_04207 [Fasciola gigantica]